MNESRQNIGKVRSVLGDIEASEMGYTMPHEHLLTGPQGEGTKNNLDHHLDSVPKAIEMLNDFREVGGGTIVETTPKTWGRNSPGMVEASRASGVHVIACTGYICQEHGMPEDVESLSIDQVAQEMIADVSEGMDGTGARAGWCKAGTAYMHITPNEEKVLRAAARAATATGVPLHTHTTGGTMGIEQAEIVASEGFDMERMIIAHVDRNPDLWYHRKMLDFGVYLIYDGPGKAKYYPDSMRVELLRQLVKDGFGERLMLSNDMGRRSHHKVYGYGPGFNWIKERFIPRLVEDEGFAEEAVHKFMYDNPQRIYAMVAPK